MLKRILLILFITISCYGQKVRLGIDTQGTLPTSQTAGSGTTTVNGQACTLGATCTITSTPGGSAGGDLAATYPNPSVNKVNGVSYPASPSTNTVPVVTGSNTVTYEAVPNAALANSSMTIAGHSVSLGGTQAISCSDLSNGTNSCSTDTTNAANITSGTLPNARIVALPNANLANSSTTVNGQTCTLGSTCSIPIGGSGTVTSAGLAGTTNQITVTGATPITTSGSWTLSIPSLLALPGAQTIGPNSIPLTLDTPAWNFLAPNGQVAAGFFSGPDVNYGDLFHVNPSNLIGTPASTATAFGTSGGAIQLTGQTGGDTTIATTGTGAAGGSLLFNAGQGGTAPNANTSSTGGGGGFIQINGKNGGAAAATGINLGGDASNISINGGTGGASSGGTSNTGGNGSNIIIKDGTGGAGATAVGLDGSLIVRAGQRQNASAVIIQNNSGSQNWLTIPPNAAQINLYPSAGSHPQQITSSNLTADHTFNLPNADSNSVQPATCTNQFASAISSAGVISCTTVTLAGAQFANQGTTTTVLHGNASGNPSFTGVSLANDTSANQGTTTTVLHGNASGQPSFGSVAAGDLASTTGSGTVVVLQNTPTLTTPNIGAATGTSLALTGKIGTYNNIATAGQGVESVYASVSTTGLSATIGVTNLQCGGAVCAAGLYLVSVYHVITTSSGTATVANAIGWNDGTAARSKSAPASATISCAATNFDEGKVVVKADGVNNITYNETVSGTIGSCRFAVYVTLTRLQ